MFKAVITVKTNQFLKLLFPGQGISEKTIYLIVYLMPIELLQMYFNTH